MNNKEMKAVNKVAAEFGCEITEVVNNSKHNKFFVTHKATGAKLLVVTASTPSSASVDFWFKKHLKQELNKQG